MADKLERAFTNNFDVRKSNWPPASTHNSSIDDSSMMTSQSSDNVAARAECFYTKPFPLEDKEHTYDRVVDESYSHLATDHCQRLSDHDYTYPQPSSIGVVAGKNANTEADNYLKPFADENYLQILPDGCCFQDTPHIEPNNKCASAAAANQKPCSDDDNLKVIPDNDNSSSDAERNGDEQHVTPKVKVTRDRVVQLTLETTDTPNSNPNNSSTGLYEEIPDASIYDEIQDANARDEIQEIIFSS
jgi:hypothetical protein